MSFSNESAISFNWLREQAGLDVPTGKVSATWDRIKTQMRNMDQVIVSTQDWVSDYWICKGAQIKTVFAAKWEPPDELDAWPVMELPLKNVRPTNYKQFLAILARAKVDGSYDSDDAVQKFYALDDATQARGDVSMHQAQYVRAWLFTALGPLLMSVTLSPQHHADALIAETVRRLLIPKQFTIAKWGLAFSEGEAEILYNCRQSPSGYLSVGTTQVGQGDEWMKHWQWLSQDIRTEDALEAVQLAARLLRSKVLVRGLFQALELKDTAVEELSTVVIRRWLLTLKAMTWLENALQQRNWDLVRPQDLACLAFNMLKPEWPRRLIAVSHRSFEIKPLLQQTRAWTSPLFAIDAIYVPAWETNTGMIWGLFANSPVIAVVDSPNYSASEWCQREAELIRHLELECDLRPGRYIYPLTAERVPEFNGIDETWYRDHFAPERGLIDYFSFPPASNVFIPQKNQSWELQMLRVAGALRVFHVCYGPELANKLAQSLSKKGFIPPIPCPTNNPGGWEVYARIFQDLASKDEAGLSLWLPQDTPALNADEIQKFSDRIPDLSTGNSVLGDVLVALEWMLSLLPILEEANLGDMILIDLRGLSKETWEMDPGYAIARGIASLRQPPRPVWFIQYAGQEIEKWGLLGGDRPIFTQHSEKQFNWMQGGSFSPDWPDTYADKCGLGMSGELREKCKGAGAAPGDEQGDQQNEQV
jgi:hypothetical protein